MHFPVLRDKQKKHENKLTKKAIRFIKSKSYKKGIMHEREQAIITTFQQ